MIPSPSPCSQGQTHEAGRRIYVTAPRPSNVAPDLGVVTPVPDLAIPNDDLARVDLALPDLAAPPDLAPISPVVCSVKPCAVQVVVAGNSSCARLSDGSVRCWGDNFT